MNRIERITALMAHAGNPIKDQKALEAASDATLTTLEAHCAAVTQQATDLKAAQDLTRYVRAFTFESKPPAFYRDRDGNAHELRW